MKNPVRDIVKSLWIGVYLNEVTRLCIESWLKLDYQLHLYIDKLCIPKEWEKYINKGQLRLLKSSDILETDNNIDIPTFADLWRYKMLYEQGGTYLDTDMFLLKRLPHDKQIISSNFTKQSGAFKSEVFYTANIGVLRFEKYSPILEYVINRIRKSNGIHSGIDRMLIFTKYVMKKCYLDVSPPSIYCPTAWWNCDEQYTDTGYTKKYNVEPLTNEYIFEHSTGVHLWNTLTYKKNKISFSTIPINSLFGRLYRRIHY